jgi:tetratricopeptide (TPR) repeat protein
MLVAASIVGLAVLALALWRFGPSLIAGRPPDPGKKAWILVAEFDGPAADSSVVAATRDLMIAALEQSEIVAAVPRDQIRLALQSAGKPLSTRVDADLARELAYRSAVRTVLEGRIGRLGKGYSLVLRLVDADSSHVVLTLSEAARDDEALIPAVDRIGKRLRAQLGERRSAIQATRRLSEAMTPSFEAYRILLRGRELLGVNENRAALPVFRSALALDTAFASAWSGIGYCFGNLDEPDSSLMAFRRTLAHPERCSESARLFTAAAIADLSGDIDGALAANEQLMRVDPQNMWALINYSYYLASAGRLGEAVESARAAEKVSPFGPVQAALSNQFWSLLALGRLEEARPIIPRLRGNLGLPAPMQFAAVAGQWAVAESLARTLQSAPGANEDVRYAAAANLGSAQASRGQVGTADQTLRQAQSAAEHGRERTRLNWTRWDRLRLAVFSRGLAADPGAPGAWDSTTAGLVVRGAWAAAAGDTVLARRMVAIVRARSATDIARQGFFGSAIVEGWIAARAGRWQEVIRLLGPAALQGEARGYAVVQSAPLLRWLVADAYEHLDRPDSAAAYLERAIAPTPLGGTNFQQIRMASSFAHQRLVVLYARMGRLEDARRHWEAFSTTFTRPDPELAPQVEEARAALASVEAMARSARR